MKHDSIFLTVIGLSNIDFDSCLSVDTDSPFIEEKEKSDVRQDFSSFFLLELM